MSESFFKSILVFDPDPSVGKAVARDLAGMVDEVRSASSAPEGIGLARTTNPNAILVALDMLDYDGLEICRALRDDEATGSTPVVFLVPPALLDRVPNALNAGGNDFLLKPFTPLEIQARVRSALLTDRLTRVLHAQAQIDPVTGLGSRSSFEARLASECSAVDRNGVPLALILLDLDDFRELNRRHGREAGDEALGRLGHTLRGSLRPYDHASRIGADEFGVILRDSGQEAATSYLQRLYESIANIRVNSGVDQVQIRCSSGISWQDRGSLCSAAEFIERAERALVQAKSQRSSFQMFQP